MKLEVPKKLTVGIISHEQLPLDALKYAFENLAPVSVNVINIKAEQLMAQATDEKLDILLLESHMMGTFGLDVAADILDLKPGIKIVLMSNYCTPSLLRKGIDVGIQGFMTKRTTSEDLLKVLFFVASGRMHIDPLYTKEPCAVAQVNLTDREVEILRLTQRGMSASEVAKSVHLSTGSVRNAMSHIVKKLHSKSTQEALYVASRHGWL